MLKRLTLGGNPNLGVYVAATEEYAFVPPQTTDKEVDQFAETLEVDVVRMGVGGTRLVGSLLVANRHGVAVSGILTDLEAKRLQKTGLNVVGIDHPLNAAGNMLLVNDKGGLVGAEYPKELVKRLEDVLDVELLQGTLADLVTVGMAAEATDRGVLVHPKASAEEQATVREALHADVMPGTINHGTALIGAGIVANSKGAAIGSQTTGIEIGRIDEALGFLDAPKAV